MEVSEFQFRGTMDKKVFFDALERRSKRLAHLIEISAPPQLISSEIMLVMQSAMGYCPEEIMQAAINCFAPKETTHSGGEETIKIDT